MGYRYKGFRLHFYSNEDHEPPHIHIRRGDDTCKFWLRPEGLAYNDGMNARELRELSKQRGKALRWDDLDEDLTVEGILAGRWHAYAARLERSGNQK